MSRCRATFVFAVAILASLAGASAAIASSAAPGAGYQVPLDVRYPAASPWFQVLDIALLLLALALAAWLSLRHRSRAGLTVLALACLAYFGFYRQGCVCAIGSIQNVAASLADPALALPLVVAVFFFAPLIVALFVGRAFCAGVCPMGALQELTLLRPVRVPIWLEHALRLLAYLYLGAAVIFAIGADRFIICEYDPFVGLFRLSGTTPMLLLGAAFLLLGMFVGRPYCRFLCPLSVLFRWTSRLSRRRITITPDRCDNCRLCETACPYNAIVTPTPPPSLTADAHAPRARRRERALLATLLLALPAFIALAAFAGHRIGQGLALGPHPSSHASSDALARWPWMGLALGAWIALVLGGKLIQLTLHRRRSQYEADPAACVSCGRCFMACPREHVRRGLVQDTPMVPLTITADAASTPHP